ncbi:MAG: hypothetical protein IPP33_07005 [Flavobacteriales bacterium]|nr:hypothetical protein [Flavobacteriales bacterium]
MVAPGFRPRFKFESPLEGAEITHRIREQLQKENPSGLWLKNAHYHITLNFPHPPPHGRRKWTSTSEEVSKGQTLVRCLDRPHTRHLDALFAAGYIGFSLLGLTGLTLGFAQLSLQQDAWGFWAVPFALLAMAFMFSIERTGRARAQDDMRLLKDFVDKALGCDCLKLADAFAH